ncbi:SPOR domain-containing protein [Pantoea sp. FN060301]|uniref:SPOR domain-containing protein n=1 Tax=Pantoea sp. FN060301 TaxID=3420380 RepID=UPI003D16A548
MDEFKPEDELKPDTSDRRPQRSRKGSSAPKTPVSRQHMMMGIGILVLLLLAIGIGSALNSSPGDGNKQAGQQPSSAAATSGSDKAIDLSSSSSMSTPSGEQTPDASVDNGNPQEISVPPVSSTPTEAQPVQTPASQQRVELPGDLGSALTNQQGQLDSAAQGSQGNGTTLPTAPATVAQSSHAADNPAAAAQSNQSPAKKPAASQKSAESKPAQKESRSHASASAGKNAAPAAKSGSAPGGSYTLQLSSASRSDTLNAWAKKQNLNSYHVYKTTRNGAPWYVLVSGSYATPAEAKRAVASLPAEVRAQKPWVKPVSQVKKESAN